MDAMDPIFKALAHPVRRTILDVLKEAPGANVGEVAERFPISRIAVMKHLRVLEEADLVLSQPEGRERHLYFNAVPIQTIYDRWTSDYSRLWAKGLTRLKYDLEAEEETP